ncbi:hypothetical protein AB0L06_08930 [Spirillospora sp. NPDC052269]
MSTDHSDPAREPRRPDVPGTSSAPPSDRVVAGHAGRGQNGPRVPAPGVPEPGAAASANKASGPQVAGGVTPGERAPADRTAADHGPRASGFGDVLLPSEEVARYRNRWRALQSAFVDDPGESVQKADELAAEMVTAIGRALTARKRELDGRVRTGDREPSDTERLRRTLRDYRDLVDRMLEV